MRTLAVVVVGIVAALVAAIDAGMVANAQPAQSRTFDRTLLCRTGIQAGQRELYVFASSGFRFVDDPSRWHRLAQVRVTSPTHASSSPETGGASAGVHAGSPKPPLDQPYSNESSLALGVNLCRSTRALVPLTARGLSGGLVNKLGENFECYPPKQVLVRVRAVFASPTTPRRRGDYLYASVPMREGRIAVRTQTGKPLVYGEALETGKARLFLAGSCVRP